MDSAYVETTIVGHLAGRIHSDPAISARQNLTRRWWPGALKRFRLLISQVVLDECQGGDPTAAKERLDEIDFLPLLEMTDEVHDLAGHLMASGAVPASEPRDALHIAIAAVHGVQYLATWNFKHIANATLRGRIEAVCRDAGFEPPIICTPEELRGATTMPDSPTDEIRAIRHELAARFDNDLSRIVEDIRRQQRASGRVYIQLPKRSPRVDRSTQGSCEFEHSRVPEKSGV